MIKVLKKLGVHFMAAGAVFLVGNGLAASPQRLLPPLEGRWAQVNMPTGHPLEIGTIEISTCDAGFCGRLVRNDTCGPVVMTLSLKEGARPWTELKLADRIFNVVFRADEGENEGGLLMVASEGPGQSRRSMMVSAHLKPDGPARCPNAPMS